MVSRKPIIVFITEDRKAVTKSIRASIKTKFGSNYEVYAIETVKDAL